MVRCKNLPQLSIAFMLASLSFPADAKISVPTPRPAGPVQKSAPSIKSEPKISNSLEIGECKKMTLMGKVLANQNYKPVIGLLKSADALNPSPSVQIILPDEKFILAATPDKAWVTMHFPRADQACIVDKGTNLSYVATHDDYMMAVKAEASSRPIQLCDLNQEPAFAEYLKTVDGEAALFGKRVDGTAMALARQTINLGTHWAVLSYGKNIDYDTCQLSLEITGNVSKISAKGMAHVFGYYSFDNKDSVANSGNIMGLSEAAKPGFLHEDGKSPLIAPVQPR